MVTKPAASDGLFEGMVMIAEIKVCAHGGSHSDDLVFVGDDKLTVWKNFQMAQIVYGLDQFIIRQRREYYFLQFFQLWCIDGPGISHYQSARQFLIIRYCFRCHKFMFKLR